MKKYLLITYKDLKVLIDRDSILYAIESDVYTEIAWKDRRDISTFCMPFEKFIQALDEFDKLTSDSSIVRFNMD